MQESYRDTANRLTQTPLLKAPSKQQSREDGIPAPATPNAKCGLYAQRIAPCIVPSDSKE